MSNLTEPKNFIDSAIEYVAPAWAAKRAVARGALASYRGAVHTRGSTNWGHSTSYRGGTARDRQDQASMRDRGRRAYRENVIAQSLLDTETDNVVAEGFTLQMQTQSEDFNKEAEGRFYRWLDKADITGKFTGAELQRISWREPRKDGDGGFIKIVRGGYPKLQYIPGDLIRNPWGGRNASKQQFDFQNTYDGVECDPTGRPIRFWVQDVSEFTGYGDFTPIDARDFQYLAHLKEPLTVRGVTVFAPVFSHLDQFDSYVDSVTKTAIMACIFGLIFKSERPGSELQKLGMQANDAGMMQKAITLDRDGMAKYLGSKDDVVQVQAQQPMQQTPDFMRALFRVICLAFQMPLEIGQKDLSQVNFSGGQLGMKDYERSCRIKQDWLKSHWNDILFWWLSVERKRQQLGYSDAFKTPFPDDYGNFELHAREWLLRDRLGEAKADLMEYAAGVSNPKRACAQRSVDYRENLRDRADAWRDNEANGIPNVLPTETRNSDQNPAVQPNGETKPTNSKEGNQQ